MIKYYKQWLILPLIVICATLLSCQKILEIDPPKDSLTQETIFRNDDIATSAMAGIYNRMAATGFSSGNATSVTSVCGVSADEFNNYGATLREFFDNQISPSNTSLYSSLWFAPYQRIYGANAILEGLAATNEVTLPVKTHLKGEALFVRAFTYFYLANLFGPVPLHLTTDYKSNEKAGRTSVANIYLQIISDLQNAEVLLTDKYITTERVRPNLATVQALLARVYLYLGDWENAELYSELVISKSDMYSLTTLEQVFIKNSKEAIWQLMPAANTNTLEGALFILTGTPLNVSLRDAFALQGFEANDKRKNVWIKTFTNSTGNYYYPAKYSIKSSTIVTEYSIVMRLAEQYLIRAEARTRLNNIEDGLSDLNTIRVRAGLLPLESPITQDELLTAIMKERFNELFSEWGHRWFDLKRTKMATSALKSLKAKWNDTDLLFPIPQNERSRNQNIDQNEGY